MKDGAAVAAGFYMGLVDDVTPRLKKMRRNYTSFIKDILRGNAQVQKSINRAKALTETSATAQMGAAVASAQPSRPRSKQKFQLALEPKRGVGLIRRLFPHAREYAQKFMGRLTPLAKGGMVRDPTAALLAEGGQPETVIPLNKMQGFFSRTLSKAVTDAGKMTGAAGGSMGKASSVRDIIVAFTKGESQLRNMVKFLEDGVASGRDAAQDAHRMAVVIASMRKDEFLSAAEKGRFIKTLKGQLVPAVEKMRKNAKAMGDIFDKNDAILQQQKDDAAQLGIMLTAAMHNLQQGVDGLGRLTDNLTSGEARKKMMQVGGMSRGDVTAASGVFTTLSDKLVSSVDLETVAGTFAEVGARGKDIEKYTTKYGRSISMLSDARGVDAETTSRFAYHMEGRMKASVGVINTVIAGIGDLSGTNAIAASDLIKNAEELLPLMQGVFKNIGASAQDSLMRGVLSQQAALGENFADFDVQSLVSDLATDVSKRSLVGSRIGMSESDLLSNLNAGNIGDIVPRIIADVQSQLAGKTGIALETSTLNLKSMYGGMLDSLDTDKLALLAASGEAINTQFTANQKVMVDSASSMDRLAKSASTTLGPMGMIKNQLVTLAGDIGLTNLVNTVQEFDFIRIGQGVLGIGMAMGGVGGVIGKVLPGLGILLAKLPLVGFLFKGAAKETGEAVGSIGKGIGNTLGSVGEGVGKFLTTVGTGLGTAITGILRGVGMGLTALVPGLAMLAAPPVLIGIGAASIGLLALGGAVWMLGKGLKEAAPFVKESLAGIAEIVVAIKPVLEGVAGIVKAQAEGIATVVDTVLRGTTDSVVQIMQTFSTLDSTQLMSVGPGLASVGIGFAAMGTGIAAGLIAMTAGNLVDKLGSLFGLSPGTGVIGALGQLTVQLVPLATAFSKLAALPSSITLPTVRAPESYPQEVLSATMRAVPNLREAAENAAYIQQSAGSSDQQDIKALLTAILTVLKGNGRPIPGGQLGALITSGSL